MMIGSISKQSFHLSIANSDNSTNKIIQKGKTERKNNSNNTSLQKNDPIKNLMEQKQRIADNRQEYLDNALSKNEDAHSIKEKLAEYDKQIADIDKQISELKMEEQKKKTSTDKKDEKAKSNSNESGSHSNSKEDINNKMMNKLVSLSKNMSQAKALSSEKALMAGEIKISDSEIKEDGNKNPVGNARKQKHIAKLESNIEQMDKTIGEKLNPNISDNNSNNVTNENDESKDEKAANNSDKPIKNSKLLKAIKTYKYNDDKTQTNDQKLNSIA